MTLCELGSVYGSCCGIGKNGQSIDTKPHKASLRVIYKREEYKICEWCLSHFDYDDYDPNIEIYQLKDGKDVTLSIRDWDYL